MGNRLKNFSYLLGEERVNSLNSKAKRVDRHSTLIKKCKLRPKLCTGEGDCPACAEDELYTRRLADYQNNLYESFLQRKKKFLEMKSLRGFKYVLHRFYLLLLLAATTACILNKTITLTLCWFYCSSKMPLTMKSAGQFALAVDEFASRKFQLSSFFQLLFTMQPLYMYFLCFQWINLLTFVTNISLLWTNSFKFLIWFF